MKEQIKKTPALAVGKEGDLVEVGKQIDVDQFNELLDVEATPVNGWIFLQPLSKKEVKTSTGIILTQTEEFRCAIVAVGTDSPYKRGQVVNLDQDMLPRELSAVYYINKKPVMKVPQHLIICIYNNIDLSTWKKETN